ncbi:dihydropteroate synthase [Pediococcus acidilactici]|uniref:dihydropteroate synthase n=1 Tax=Pediococcus acidilactici TaxID=1254 RepID=UPI001311308A|nr:dihydropteroate synthase [Pediococcus acidilactici]KAF0341289.1 dihydropteroate synthase [Pediococcus acidilactici]KAF0352818.1 dihydropteroate synthase [Pediococcus acidilactici]KAF0356625.1 dihydropteroate synthase [Pediococcus acidilactici]KAF0358709.1 dihydropteroate synthase [Pediococcus acidilactici]KAF0375134.1 dihydropteroate synthase [Pediococcus acidilactici]
MKIYEQHLQFSSQLENKIWDDLLNRQRYLALKVIADDAAKLRLLAKLLDQMDLIHTVEGLRVDLLLPRVNLALFKEKLTEIFNDPSLDQQMNDLNQKYRVLWQAGRFEFNLTERPVIYGILNVTPDSFYDGGWYQSETAILKRVSEMVDAGVDVIEVGGQTTRPGFVEIPPEEELKRVTQVLDLIQKNFSQVAVAIDTYKYAVMERVIDYIDIINDVNAFTDDQRKLALMRNSNIGLLTMHSARNKDYDNLTAEMKAFFEENIATLVQNGININRIALDQGIGYAKKADGYQDYAMMNNIDQFNYLNRPMMIAISRKGFGAKLFGLPKEDRLPVTLVAEAYMYLHGGRILRVHDIAETVQLAKMLDVIQNGYWFGS